MLAPDTERRQPSLIPLAYPSQKDDPERGKAENTKNSSYAFGQLHSQHGWLRMVLLISSEHLN
jgi:hypothetical protein